MLKNLTVCKNSKSFTSTVVNDAEHTVKNNTTTQKVRTKSAYDYSEFQIKMEINKLHFVQIKISSKYAPMYKKYRNIEASNNLISTI
jgi:hypothetical protein